MGKVVEITTIFSTWGGRGSIFMFIFCWYCVNDSIYLYKLID